MYLVGDRSAAGGREREGDGLAHLTFPSLKTPTQYTHRRAWPSARQFLGRYQWTGPWTSRY